MKRYPVAVNSYTLSNIADLIERKTQLQDRLGHISDNLNPVNYTLKQILDHVGSGGHIVLGEFEDYRNNNNARVIKRNNESFISTHFLAIDIDDTDCEISAILEHSYLCDLVPIMYYETLSHKTPHKDPNKAKSTHNNRYRLIYLLEEPITDRQTLEDMNTALYNLFKSFGADEAAKDVARLFLGTDKNQRAIKAIATNNIHPVTVETVQGYIKPFQEQREQQALNVYKPKKTLLDSSNVDVTSVLESLGAEIGGQPYQEWKNLIFSIVSAFEDYDQNELLEMLVSYDVVYDDTKARKEALNLIKNYNPNATNAVTLGTLIYFAKQNGYNFKGDRLKIKALNAVQGGMTQDEAFTLAMCLHATEEPREHITAFLQHFNIVLPDNYLSLKETQQTDMKLTPEIMLSIMEEAETNGFKYKQTPEQLGLKRFTSNQIELTTYVNGEYKMSLNDLQPLLKMKGNILLQSYAGTGKTTQLMDLFDEYLFLVPTIAIMNDLAKKHYEDKSIIFVGGGLGGFDESVLECKKIVMTYDQFKEYLHHCNNKPRHKRIIIDECHKLGGYSDISVEKGAKLQLIHDELVTFEQRIYVSATVYNMPDIFDYVLSYYTPQKRIIKAYQLEQRPHGVKKNPSKEYFSVLKEVINLEKKSFILCNMIKLEEIKELAEQLAAHFKCKVDVIHSKDRTSDSYKSIAFGVGDVSKIVLATSLMNVGVDLQGTFQHSYIIGTHDLNDIEQAINRERQAEQFHIILPNKQTSSIYITRNVTHISPKGTVKSIKEAQKVTIQAPYTSQSFMTLNKEHAEQHSEQEFLEHTTLYNDISIQQTIDNTYITDLFHTQNKTWYSYTRDNMTTNTLIELLKPHYPNLDTTVTTLITDFDEPTKQTKREAQDITQVKMKDIQTFMGKVSLAISSAKSDTFKYYSPELLESVEFDLLTTLARNIAIAEALDNHLAEQPIQKTIKVISKESKNLELWDYMLTNYNTTNNTTYTVIADKLSPILGKELSPSEYKSTLNSIKSIYSHVLTSRYTNKSLEILLTERLGYKIEEMRTVDKRIKIITKEK